VPALDPDDPGELALLYDAPHVGALEGQLELVRVSARLGLQGVDHRVRAFRRRRRRHLRAHPDGEDLRIEPSLPRARKVDVPIRMTFGEIDRMIADEPHCRVAVRVENDRLTMKLHDFLRGTRARNGER
jgi:hypothetical protein